MGTLVEHEKQGTLPQQRAKEHVNLYPMAKEARSSLVESNMLASIIRCVLFKSDTVVTTHFNINIVSR